MCFRPPNRTNKANPGDRARDAFRRGFRLLLALAAPIVASLLLNRFVEALRRNKALRAKVEHPYNAAVRTFAGDAHSPFALLTHVGRHSGRTYETPIGTFRLGDGFVLVLVYGRDTDWYHNVLAAGTCMLTWQGQTYRLERPETLPLSTAWDAFALPVRLLLASLRVQEVVWLHRQPEAAPTQDALTPAVASGHGAPPGTRG